MSDLERLLLLQIWTERKIRTQLAQLVEKRPLTLADLESASFIISEYLDTSYDSSEISATVYKFFFQIILRRGMEKMLQNLEEDSSESESDSGQSETSFLSES